MRIRIWQISLSKSKIWSAAIPANVSVFSRLVARYRKRAIIEGRDFHDLRRTAVTKTGKIGATIYERLSLSGSSLKSKMFDTCIK